MYAWLWLKSAVFVFVGFLVAVSVFFCTLGSSLTSGLWIVAFTSIWLEDSLEELSLFTGGLTVGFVCSVGISCLFAVLGGSLGIDFLVCWGVFLLVPEVVSLLGEYSLSTSTSDPKFEINDVLPFCFFP